MILTIDPFRTLIRASRQLTLLSALALASCGGSDGLNTMTAPMSPTVTLSIDKNAITVGQSATLTWGAGNASTCTASGAWSGTVSLSDRKTVTPTASGTDTYTLTCTTPTGSGYSGGGGGTATMSVTLMVSPASAYAFKNLVSDLAGTDATTTDGNLKNPWGIVFGPTTPVWVANNHSDTSTLYDGNGAVIPLVANLPMGFSATGIVFNGATNGDFGSAPFIFTGEAGMIASWTPPGTGTVTRYTGGDAAVYKGLAIANNGSANFLYATDFHNNKIDVFDKTFTRQTPSATRFAFVDPKLPAGYAPFGIQAIANGVGNAVQLYVSYAMKPTGSDDNAGGAGLGLIDIFDANGNFVKTLVPVGGALDGPWGFALAPANFGTLSNKLLVSNFGDGRINGYDASTGEFIGAVSDSSGTPFAVRGLWGIAFGNGAHSQPTNTLYFAAGINDEVNGSYGRIDLQ